jgi:hypothetical protein
MAVAAPIPLLAPVTNTILFFNDVLNMLLAFFCEYCCILAQTHEDRDVVAVFVE